MSLLDVPAPDVRVPLDDLADALGEGRVLTDTDTTGRYVHDEAEWAPAGAPLVTGP